MLHDHTFYLALGYGLSALVILIEVANLWQTARKRKQAAKTKDLL